MYQRTYAIHDEREAYELIGNPTIEHNYTRAKNCLALCYSSHIDKRLLMQAIRVLRRSYPRMKIAVATQFGHENLNNEQICRVSFLFFSESDVALDIYNFDLMSYDEVYEQISASIEESQDLQMMQFIGSIWNFNLSGLVERLMKNYPDYLMSGFLAGPNLEDVNKYPAFVMIDQPVQNGLLVIRYLGKNLHVYTDEVFGWKPVSRSFRVEARANCSDHAGDTEILSLDGIPSSVIYDTYLGINSHNQLMDNVVEFPLILERSGELFCRAPLSIGEKNQLYCFGDVRDGETVRLGYGSPDRLVKESILGARRLYDFHPEAVCLTVCSARPMTLGERYPLEIKNFLRTCVSLTYINTTGEIYQRNGRGGVKNGSLIVVGLREGENTLKLEQMEQYDILDMPADFIDEPIRPLNERLISFLDKTTSDLNEMAAEANAANASKSQFLSNMSHEIRTPINAVLGMDEMILRETKEAETLQYASNIKIAGNTLLSLINDILDFSRIEAGGMSILPVEYDMKSFLNDLMTLVRGKIEDKGLRLVLDIDPEIPDIIHGDSIRLRQCLVNILTNAAKYTMKGSVTVNVKVLERSTDAVLIRYSVTDTGIGIRPDELEKLFQAFERLDEKRNRDIEGTGLGINITERLLRLMGSRLEVQSEYGKGSTFSFSIRQQVIDWKPIGDYSLQLAEAPIQEAYHGNFIAPDAHILVVDDAPMNIQVIRGLLKENQIHIDSAISGQECLELCEDNEYDLILLDHRMPEMDGVETLKHLKEPGRMKKPDTPIVCLTANAIIGAREKYLSYGFTDYLTKPVRPDRLEDMVRSYLPENLLQLVDNKRSLEKENKESNDFYANIPVWLSEIPEINVAKGIDFCGSVSNFMQALETYVVAIPENSMNMEIALERKDYSEFVTRAHALKSTSGAVGVMELAGFAAALEDAANAGKMDPIKNYGHVLIDRYRDFATTVRKKMVENVENAKSVVEKDVEKANQSAAETEFSMFLGFDAVPEDESLPEISMEELADAYRTILEVQSNFDFDTLTIMMESLKGYRIPKEERERYTRLKQYAARPEWDKIEKLLQEFR